MKQFAVGFAILAVCAGWGVCWGFLCARWARERVWSYMTILWASSAAMIPVIPLPFLRSEYDIFFVVSVWVIADWTCLHIIVPQEDDDDSDLITLDLSNEPPEPGDDRDHGIITLNLGK